MKTLTARSATLAACTALLIAGTAGPASADATDDPAPYRLIAVKGNNNNVAGNDLIIGNNNNSGTGHTIGQPTQPQFNLSQATVNVYNCSGSTLTLSPVGDNPSTNGGWLSPAATPPSRIPSHPATLDGNACLNESVSANWTSATTDSVLTSNAQYDVDGVLEGFVQFHADAGRGVQASVNGSCSTNTFTCDWLTSAQVDGTDVRGVVNFVIVPRA
ncbi:hypothetical protein ACFV16_39825 [Streptomyces massasporeus]|uniref:hypothetical protein n=1 Tax=Streptomyces massasporeus TaxID=67324 RepID=UPI0036B6F4DC